MRADIIRIYKSVHTWTGILSGMALFIAFYAGALTVFKEPIARWASPPPEVAMVPLADTPELIAKTLKAHPEAAKGFVIHLKDEQDVPGRMSWEVRDPEADDHDTSASRHFVASLNAQGNATVHEDKPSPLADFIDVLHRVVGLPADSDPHRWIMGVIASLYAVALVSGVIVLLPSLVKDFFALRVGKNFKRMWLDAHNVVGIVSLPFHIVIALSSAVFAFHDQIYMAQDKVVHEGKWSTAFQRGGPKPGKTPARDPSTMRTPQQLADQARALSPGFEPSSLQYQGVLGPRAVVRVWGKNDAAVLPRAMGGFVAIDPYSGKVSSRDYLPGGQDTPNLWISSFFALHMAAYGGITVQWMYFLLGLSGAWLFYSGNLLWVETRRRRASKATPAPVQRMDTRLMAAASVGVCLGSVCGISLMIVGSKWIHLLSGSALGWHQALYYTTFFACVAWAFWRGAARAGMHLLWAASASTMAIPLSTVIAWGLPGAAPWANASPTSLGVDITAMALALCFAWMALATARRVQQGPQDSVWSAAVPAAQTATAAQAASAPM
jgi:uncharacterized iron-regulated membrane protein